MQSLQQSQFRVEQVAPSNNPVPVLKTDPASKDLQNNLVMEEEDEISDEEMMVNSIFKKKEDGSATTELQERERPIGKSPEALERLSSGPKDTSSPVLLAPLAKDDSPCGSLGDTSTITLQRYVFS